MRAVFVFIRQSIVVVFITIVLLEIVLRAFHYVSPQSMFYTGTTRFRVLPHTPYYGFKLNSHGFHDVEFNVEKAAGTFRILGIGDSFAFGAVPYRHNYLTTLEEGLNATGRRFELINMGIPGTGPPDYLALLIDEGLRLKPDMVLLSLFVGNDLATPAPRRLDHSYIVRAAKHVHVMSQPQAKFDFSSHAAYDDGRVYSSDEDYIKLEMQRSAFFRTGNERSINGLIDNAMRSLAEIKRLCDQEGIRLTVALLPDELQVDPVLQQQVGKAAGIGSEAFDFSLANSLLKSRFKALQIEHVDLLADFRAAGATTRLYRRNDTHWNIKGNELASRVILRHLLPSLSEHGAN